MSFLTLKGLVKEIMKVSLDLCQVTIPVKRESLPGKDVPVMLSCILAAR